MVVKYVLEMCSKAGLHVTTTFTTEIPTNHNNKDNSLS